MCVFFFSFCEMQVTLLLSFRLVWFGALDTVVWKTQIKRCRFCYFNIASFTCGFTCTYFRIILDSKLIVQYIYIFLSRLVSFTYSPPGEFEFDSISFFFRLITLKISMENAFLKWIIQNLRRQHIGERIDEMHESRDEDRPVVLIFVLCVCWECYEQLRKI